jgi:hypothetical protein
MILRARKPKQLFFFSLKFAPFAADSDNAMVCRERSRLVSHWIALSASGRPVIGPCQGCVPMRKLSVFLMCVLAGGLVWLDASAQDPGGGVLYCHWRQFKIPFKNDPKTGPIAQVRLYVSRDQGSNWSYTATAPAEDQHFSYNASQDGLYWFAAQTVDFQGKLYPPTLDGLRPSLKVVVDTTPPTVQIQGLPPRNNEVGVAWNVSDDNLDRSLPDGVQLQYRMAGGVTWVPLIIAPGSSQHYWNPQTNAAVEVRVLARDRAGNTGENKTTVSLVGGAGQQQAFNDPLVGIRPESFAPKDLARKYVNSKQVSLHYGLKDVGPSGVSVVELWYTIYNGRAWNKLTEYPIDIKNTADTNPSKKLKFEIQEDGVYGITLVAKSGVGFGQRPPQVGDSPQFWLEVDTVKPQVQILGVNVGNGVEKGKVTIQWDARDRNLGPTPIRLAYSEKKDGSWTTFADKLENTNRYVWTMPQQPAPPYQFYIRVEAIDMANNVGEAVTPERVKVDLSVPRATIENIEPGGK